MEMQTSDAELLAQETVTKARSGDMLYEIFPKRIADDLQAGKKVENPSRTSLSPLFSPTLLALQTCRGECRL